MAIFAGYDRSLNNPVMNIVQQFLGYKDIKRLWLNPYVHFLSSSHLIILKTLRHMIYVL